ncbi:MAG: hypothetical protein ABI471_07450 [Sphingomonas bacterium]
MSDRSMLIRPTLAIAFGAMLAASAVPAFANEKPANSNETAQAGSQPSRKYCLSATVTGEPLVTGTIVPKRQCLTQDQWAAKGVTFKAK